MQPNKRLLAAHPIKLTLTLLIIFICSGFFYTSIKASPDENETTYYFLTDHLGSIDVVTDSEGNVVERRDYLPYGQQRHVHEELNAPETNYGYTGKELDSETGLMYYEARYYDAQLGRFISPDTWEGNLTDPQSLNKYTYVNNNPTKYVDPTGMWGILPNGNGGMAHQYITGQALNKANICLTPEQKNNLVYATSVYADVTVNLFEKKMDYHHATSSGNETTPLEMKEVMMNDAKEWYTSGDLKKFGRLIHMVQDTYCPSHVKRDEDGNIVAFYDYNQQSVRAHIKGDNYLDENGQVKPETKMATAATTELINLYYSGAGWDEVGEYIDTEVLKGISNEDTEVGKPGEKFKDD